MPRTKTIASFSEGLDLRKSAVTANEGSLRQITNAFVNAGAEIEKRKAWTSVGVCPTGDTFGLGFLDNKLAVFGTEAAGAIGTLPDYTNYYQLILAAPGPTIERVLDVSPFSTGLYVIARFSDGNDHHFFVTGATATEVTGVTGSNSRTHSSKMYVVDGRNLRFSAVDDPSDYAGVGSGIIDVTAQDTGSTELVGIEQYYSYLALFARNAVQVWFMDPDPAKNALVQVLGNIGLVAPNAVVKYGNGDALFLSDTGVRSLRARDSSNAAVLNDVGSPIDSLISALRADLTPAIAEKITAMVDPLSGHAWFVWGTTVFVLAYYPNSKITAWSTFTTPFTPDYVALANSRLVLRAGEELFVYGSVPPAGNPFDPNVAVGSTSALYDAAEVIVELPPIDCGSPSTDKTWLALDVACEGVWKVYVNPDPTQSSWTHVATVNGSSYLAGILPVDMSSTHLGLKFVSETTGKQVLSRVTVHYDDGSEDHRP